MKDLDEDLRDIADDLMDHYQLTDFEALQIGVSLQQNRILQQAFVIFPNTPSALEAIAMQLGSRPSEKT